MKTYKYVIMILVSFVSCNVTKPPEERPDVTSKIHTAIWVSKGNEYGVVNYTLQKSRTGKSAWSTIVNIAPKHFPDSNIYKFQLPKTTLSNYYRVYITMTKGTYVSKTQYLSNSVVR